MVCGLDDTGSQPFLTCESQVMRDLSGPPNYWDLDRIENNMFRRYRRSDLDGSLCDSDSIIHYRSGSGFPPSLISTSVLCNLSRALTLQLKYIFHFGPATTDLKGIVDMYMYIRIWKHCVFCCTMYFLIIVLFCKNCK